MKQDGRIEWLDVLKGIAIFLVVLGHSGASPVKSYVYAFHMPLFFMLAGYTASLSYSRRNNAFSFIKGRFTSLFVPMVAWGLFGSLFFCSREAFLNFDIMCGLKNIAYGNVNIWFIPALLCLQLLYVLYRVAVKLIPPPATADGSSMLVVGKHVVTAILLYFFLFEMHRLFGKSFHGFGSNIEWLTNAYNHAIPFAIGALIQQKGEPYINLVHAKSKWLFTVTCLVTLLCWGQVQSIGILNDNHVKALAGSCISYTLIVALANSTLPAWFKEQTKLIGKHTLVIYLAASSFQAASFCQFEGFNALLAFIIYGCTSLAACYACVLFANVVGKSPLLAFLLLGKAFPKNQHS